jgi:hypothetical protein
MKSICTHTEETLRLGRYAGEDGQHHWLRIVRVVVLARAEARFRVDFAVAGMPDWWSVSLDGFTSLAEAEDYVAMTTEVAWVTAAGAYAAIAGQARTAASATAWYSGSRAAAGALAAPGPEYSVDDFVDAAADYVEVIVELDDLDPVDRAA